jgi:hypothetical protein
MLRVVRRGQLDCFFLNPRFRGLLPRRITGHAVPCLRILTSVFTTPNRTNGSGLPTVTPFNASGGAVSNAAELNVGDANFDGTAQSGGLSQTISSLRVERTR